MSQEGAPPGEGARPAPGAGTPQASPELAEVLGGVFYQFRVALANLQLYAAGSQQAVKACNGMYDVLASFLEKQKTLAVSDAGDALIANGAPMQLCEAHRGAAEYFQRVIRRAGIKSLTFTLGITLEELYQFLDWFHERRLDKDGGQPAPAQAVAMPADRFAHISFNEAVFVSVSDDDLVMRGAGAKLGQMGGAVEEVMREVQKLMDLTELDDPNKRDKVRLEIARKLVESDPGLLAKLNTGLGDVPERPAEATAAGNLQIPADLMRESSVELARVYRDLSSAAGASGALGESLAALKKTITRLLALTGGTPEMSRIYHDMIETGGAHLLPGDAGPSAQAVEKPEEAARRIIAGDSLELMKEDVMVRLPEMVASLDLAQRSDLTEKLLDRFAENLSASTVAVRQKAAEGFKSLLEAARHTSRPGVVDRVDPALLGAQEGEADAKIYGDLAGMLTERASDLMARGNYGRTAEILGLFRRHRNSASNPFEDRPGLATQALEAISRSGMTETLLADLLSGDPARIEAARELAVKLEELGAGAIVSAVKTVEDLRARRVLVSVARNMGESAVIRLVAQFDEERSGRALERLLEVAWDLGKDEIMLDKLRALTSHPERRVRYKLVEILQAKGTPQAADAILAMTCDENKDVRLAVLTALGELRHAPAVSALCGLLPQGSLLGKDEEPEIQAAACAALGKIGSEACAAPLLGVLAAKGLLSRLKPPHPSVRIAAASGLAAFAARPEVQEALRALLKDPYLAIQHAAAKALGIQPTGPGGPKQGEPS